MGYTVYILRSKRNEKYYIGQTSNIEKRLAGHQSGNTFSTRSGRLWEIIYVEKHNSRSEAVKRE